DAMQAHEFGDERLPARILLRVGNHLLAVMEDREGQADLRCRERAVKFDLQQFLMRERISTQDNALDEFGALVAKILPVGRPPGDADILVEAAVFPEVEQWALCVADLDAALNEQTSVARPLADALAEIDQVGITDRTASPDDLRRQRKVPIVEDW